MVPISALHGDNIVTRSDRMPWYHGPSLLHHLEHVHIASDRNLVDVRFPVQHVIRPQSTVVSDYRGYAGQVASGVLKPGDEVMVLPSGYTTRIAAIDTDRTTAKYDRRKCQRVMPTVSTRAGYSSSNPLEKAAVIICVATSTNSGAR